MFTSAIGGLLLLVVLGSSQGAPTAVHGKRTHDITIDDYFTLAYIGECEMRPDGSNVAFTDSRWSPDHESRNRDIWMVNIRGEHLQRLTFNQADDWNISWSNDGSWIYFQSRRFTESGGSQVWRLSPETKTIQQVTRVKGGIDQYQLSRGSDRLYFLCSRDAALDDRWKELRSQFDDLQYGSDAGEHSELWGLDLTTWRLNQLVTPKGFYRGFSVNDHGQKVALVKVPDDELISHEGWSQIDIVDVPSGKTTTMPDALWRSQGPSPYGWIESPTWSADGSRLAFSVDFDGYPQEVFVATFPEEASPTIHKLPRTLFGDEAAKELTTSGRLTWRPKSHDLCFLAESHAVQRVYQIKDAGGDPASKATVLTPGKVVIDAFSFDDNGQHLAVVTSGLIHFNDVFLVMDLGSEAQYRRLTNVNSHVDQWRLPQVKVVQWKAPDGVTVEGILELPPGYDQQADGPLPLLVQLHGGPTSSSKYRLQYWVYGRTLFPARGWALLSPNYRGSTGYGDKFLTDLIEQENDIEVSDILAGVDAMVELGIADPERLAVSGWSNGGYLTNCLITQTDRFKAASSGAGVFDMTMQWAVEDTPGHVINYAGGLPWERPQAMQQMSPLYRADEITTPTLIHCGANDARVPVAHSQALHRALSRYLDVPSELVVYPNTAHGLSRRSDREAKLQWDVQWLEGYTLGDGE